MDIVKDERNIRYEYELDKIKKKKKDNLLIMNILYNKINYICYILKSNHRDILNDINFENRTAIEICLYYCKSYILFLLLFYPYLHNYIRILKNNDLRLYKNFYKYILKRRNNLHILLLKYRILECMKLKDKDVNDSNTISYIDVYSMNRYMNDEDDIDKYYYKPKFSYKNNNMNNLLLLNVYFKDIMSKNNFICILFSRIYIKKYHKKIFRILLLILFYFSLPTFPFSKKFFITYHNWRDTEKDKIKEENEENHTNTKGINNSTYDNIYRSVLEDKVEGKLIEHNKNISKNNVGVQAVQEGVVYGTEEILKNENKGTGGMQGNNIKKKKDRGKKKDMDEDFSFYCKRKYFTTPFFEHINIPTIHINDYFCSGNKIFEREEFKVINEKKNKKKERQYK